MSEQTINPDTRTEEKEGQPTPEQMAEMKAKMLAYYNEQIPFLEIQERYETLAATIEEARFRRMRATMSLAQMMAPPPPQEEKATERPLKKG